MSPAEESTNAKRSHQVQERERKNRMEHTLTGLTACRTIFHLNVLFQVEMLGVIFQVFSHVSVFDKRRQISREREIRKRHHLVRQISSKTQPQSTVLLGQKRRAWKCAVFSVDTLVAINSPKVSVHAGVDGQSIFICACLLRENPCAPNRKGLFEGHRLKKSWLSWQVPQGCQPSCSSSNYCHAQRHLAGSLKAETETETNWCESLCPPTGLDFPGERRGLWDQFQWEQVFLALNTWTAWIKI